MALKVIGAGFGRTGTDSMREALNLLGLGPCLHMFEIIGNEELKLAWRAKARGEPISWETLCRGYVSAVDWPVAYYWRELIKVYPEAKVILTYRPAESWYASFEKTILPHISATSDPESLGVRVIRNMVFGGNPEDKAHAIATYEANVLDVLKTVPRNRLLIHEFGDGWESLCSFLGVPIPQQEFPNRNSSENFKARVQEAVSEKKLS